MTSDRNSDNLNTADAPEETDSLEALERALTRHTEKIRRRAREKRRMRTFNRLLILVVIAVVALGAVFVRTYIKWDRALDLTEPYTVSSLSGREENTATGSEAGLSPSLASDLVVSAGTKSCEGITLSSTAERGLLFNIERQEAVFAQGIYEQAYPASITKIMTAILALEYGNMDETVVMEDSDFSLEEGSQLSGLAVGDQVTMEQLLNVLLVYSANDAAMAIARQVAGSVGDFVHLMNDKASELGMTGTHFVNPSGLHNDNHYTTAYDVYLMLNYACSLDNFTAITQQYMYELNFTHADGSEGYLKLDSTDNYLTGTHEAPENVYLLGGKTGTTDEAGSCLALVAQNQYGVPYIAVILKAENHATLYADMDQLLKQMNA